MIIGITGGIGSGKTTVLAMFKKMANIAVYIADKEAKLLINTSKIIQSKLIAEFGKGVYKDYILQKQYLAAIVFSDKKKLEKLNAIVHPIVAKHFKEFVQKNKDKDYILYENAILFENKSDIFCDIIITVIAPLSIRLERVVNRDKSSKEAVLNRINNQWSAFKKVIQSNYIIENNNLKKTEKQVKKIHQLLMQKKLLFSKTSK